MKKTAIPIKISEGKPWVNPKFDKTIYYYQIEFDNSDKGQFSTSINPQTKFTIGESVEYTYDQDKDKDGKDKLDKYQNPVMKIDKFKEPFVQGGGKKVMTNPSTEKSIASSVALKCSRIFLLKKDNITPTIIKTLANDFYLYLITDNIIYTESVEKFDNPSVQLAIQKQTALAEACEFCSILSYKKEEIIAIAKDYYQFINFKSNI